MPARGVIEGCFSGVVGTTIVIAVLGALFNIWMKTDLMSNTFNFAECGFDKHEFAALALFVFGSASSFSLLTLCVTYPARASGNSKLARAPQLLLGVAVIALGGVAFHNWGDDLRSCMVIGCPGHPQKAPSPFNPIFLGWKGFVGFSAFLSLVPIGIILVVQTLVLRRGARQHENIEPLLNHHASGSPWRKLVKRWLYALAFTTFLCLMLFFTSYLPSRFSKFVSWGISFEATRSWETPCANSSVDDHGACPEYPWAFFHTKSYKLNDHITMNFFPSNVFFYTYLLLVVILGTFSRLTVVSRKFMGHQIAIGASIISVGSTLFTLLTFAFFLLFALYWLHDHSFNSAWSNPPANQYGVVGISHAERWARALGQLAVACISLLFVPASRSSPIHDLLGTSFESFLLFHKVLGFGALTCIFGHMVAWCKYLKINDAWPSGFMMLPPFMLPTIGDGWNFTIPLGNVVGLAVLIIMLLFTVFPVVRRRFFELFYYSHIFAAYALIPVVLWHANAGWEFILPGLTMWFFDRLMRLWRSGRTVSNVSFTPIGTSFVQVRFQMRALQAEAGQYIFINVPSVSAFEWHPFSVIVHPTIADEYYLLIRVMGENTWTGRLHAAVSRCGTNGLVLLVDGPCGLSVPERLRDHDSAVFVCGGIGITPCLSSIIALAHKKSNLRLIWVVREEELVDAVQSVLHDAPHVQQFLSTFVTGSGKSRGAGGRPVLSDELRMSRPLDNVSTMIFACGPESLVRDAARNAAEFGYNFHAETFFL